MTARHLPLLGLLPVFLCLCLISMNTVSGPFDNNILAHFSLDPSTMEAGILYYLILPRTLMAVLAGAALGMSGTLIQ